VIAIPNAEDYDLSDLAAHEFFHAWNVKQIRPYPLGPFDYNSPQRTGNLWFAEGVTDYYAKILTYRSGFHDLTWLLSELSDQVASYQSGKTRLKSTVEDASRAVWEHQGFSLGDLDYYNKGLLAGLIFDAKIREATGGQKSLDDVMRLMYARFRYPHPGYKEDGIRQAIIEVSGTDLGPLYDELIRSTQELPYANLRAIGLQVAKPNESVPIALGFPTPTDNLPVTQYNGYGLQEADQFVRFLPQKIDGQAMAEFDRDGTLKPIQLPLAKRTFPNWTVLLDETPTAAESDLFKGWSHR
jgi:predicted metalloprotease with PDZ domain